MVTNVESDHIASIRQSVPTACEGVLCLIEAVSMDPLMKFNDWWDVYRKQIRDEDVGLSYGFAKIVWKFTEDYRSKWRARAESLKREKAERRKKRGIPRRKKKAVL